MTYRLHYVDAGGQPHLVAVAGSLDEATARTALIGKQLPEAGDRVCVVDDVRGGRLARVVQAPENLDATGGVPTLFLAGGTDGCADWQSEAVGMLAGQRVVVLNPRREHPSAEDPASVHAQAAWEHRHVGRADLVLFWLAEDGGWPLALYLLGTTVANPVACVVGAHPGYPLRAELLPRLGYERPSLVVHDSLAATVDAAVSRLASAELADGPLLSQRLDNPEISAWHLQLAAAALSHGPGLAARLDHLAAEAAAGAFHLDRPVLLATVYLCVDRLRADPTDPLAWTQVEGVITGLAELTGRRPEPPRARPG